LGHVTYLDALLLCTFVISVLVYLTAFGLVT
jgi:hypothetical protein